MSRQLLAISGVLPGHRNRESQKGCEFRCAEHRAQERQRPSEKNGQPQERCKLAHEASGPEIRERLERSPTPTDHQFSVISNCKVTQKQAQKCSNPIFCLDAAFVLTVESFLLTVGPFYLQLTILVLLLAVGAFFCLQLEFFCLLWESASDKGLKRL